MLFRVDQLADDACDPGAGFAFTKDHFGKAAPLPALQIDVGVTQVGDGGWVNGVQRQAPVWKKKRWSWFSVRMAPCER
jgi:hypothetical protein